MRRGSDAGLTVWRPGGHTVPHARGARRSDATKRGTACKTREKRVGRDVTGTGKGRGAQAPMVPARRGRLCPRGTRGIGLALVGPVRAHAAVVLPGHGAAVGARHREHLRPPDAVLRTVCAGLFERGHARRDAVALRAGLVDGERPLGGAAAVAARTGGLCARGGRGGVVRGAAARCARGGAARYGCRGRGGARAALASAGLWRVHGVLLRGPLGDASGSVVRRGAGCACHAPVPGRAGGVRVLFRVRGGHAARRSAGHLAGVCAGDLRVLR